MSYRLTPDITVHGRMPTKLEYEKSLALLRRTPLPATVQLDDVEQTVLIEMHRQGLVRTREGGGLYNNELVLTEYGKVYLSQRTKNNPFDGFKQPGPWVVLWHKGRRIAARPLSELPQIQKQFRMNLLQRDASGTEHWNVLSERKARRRANPAWSKVFG